MSLQEMLAMDLNTVSYLNNRLSICRVPGGWIYKWQANVDLAVFVPEPKQEFDFPHIET